MASMSLEGENLSPPWSLTCNDTVRRQSSINQKEGENITMLAPWTWISSLQTY